MLLCTAANKFHCVKLVMSCMIHAYVLKPGQLNEDRKAQQHHLSKISWRCLLGGEGGGGGGENSQIFADGEVSSPCCRSPALSQPSAAVRTLTDDRH